MTHLAALLVTILTAGPVTGMAGNAGPNKAHQGTRGGTSFGAPTPTAPTSGPGSHPAKEHKEQQRQRGVADAGAPG
jgi:hypothetical protein